MKRAYFRFLPAWFCLILSCTSEEEITFLRTNCFCHRITNSQLKPRPSLTASRLWMRADFSTVTQNTRLRRQDSGMFIASPGWRPGFNIPRGLVLAHRRTSKTITECSNWGSGFCAPVFLYVLRWHLNYAINFHSVMNSRAA